MVKEEQSDSWYGTGYQEPYNSGRANLIKFKGYTSVNKEKSDSDNWQVKRFNDFEDEIIKINKDIFDIEDETDYIDIKNKEDDFDYGLPDKLDNKNQIVSQKYPRRNSLVDYNDDNVMNYSTYGQLIP